MELISAMDAFEDTVLLASNNLAVHTISHYLQDFAGKIHSYYAKNQVIGDDVSNTKARLLLLKCCAQVIKNGLYLLGVDAPESM